MEYKNTKIFILYLPNNKRYLVLALIFHSCRYKEKLKLAQDSRTSARWFSQPARAKKRLLLVFQGRYGKQKGKKLWSQG